MKQGSKSEQSSPNIAMVNYSGTPAQEGNEKIRDGRKEGQRLRPKRRAGKETREFCGIHLP